MSKSLEIVNETLGFQIVSTVKLLGNIDKKIFKLSLTDLDTIKQDLERLEKINEVWNDNEPMESVDINDEHLQELYDYINKLEKENEQLKQQRDRLAIDNGELCVKICKLEKAFDKACEMLNWDCPVGINLIDDLDCENCCDDTKECWKKYFLNLADVEVIDND